MGLEARGFALERAGEDILIRPSSKLSDADRRNLRRWKSHILALLAYQPQGVQ